MSNGNNGASHDKSYFDRTFWRKYRDKNDRRVHTLFFAIPSRWLSNVANCYQFNAQRHGGDDLCPQVGKNKKARGKTATGVISSGKGIRHNRPSTAMSSLHAQSILASPVALPVTRAGSGKTVVVAKRGSS
jgi:hypothetical protein